jgi:hypothetical protein
MKIYQIILHVRQAQEDQDYFTWLVVLLTV